jgi:ABC-type sugar transport system substrate-binding protein
MIKVPTIRLVRPAKTRGRSTMKMRGTWLLVTMTALLVVGCGDDGENGGATPTGGATETGDATESVNIWYVNPLPNTPDWGRSADLFEDAAAEIGYEATVVGPDAIDIPAMITQIEQAIADGADGIITCPLDPAAFEDVINTAQEQGIVVVSIGCVDDNADFSIGTDNDTYGRTSADIIAEQTGGEAGVGILGTDQTTPNQVAQVEAFRDQIASEHPGIQELVWESDNSDAGVAAQKIPAMVAAYPEMNYLWIIEGAAPGAVPAGFQEAGVDPGEIQVLAIDAQESTLQAIEDGWITATLNQCWFDASPDAAERIIATLDGEEQEQFIPIDVDPVTAEDLPYEGCPEV